MVEEYIKDEDPMAAIILTDRLKINECFHHFKTMLKKGGFSVNNMSSSLVKNENKIMMENKSIINEQDTGNNGRSGEEIKRLKLLVQQKDNEITLLLSLINKKRSQQAGKGDAGNDVVLGGRPSR